MNLKEYVDKRIRITLKEGDIIEGKCVEYVSAIENDPEIDSIDLKIGKDIYEIFENEIKHIEIL